MNSPHCCTSCRTSDCSDGFLTLWNEREYCVECVRKESLELLKHAQEHRVLEETYDYPTTKWITQVLLLSLGVSLIFFYGFFYFAPEIKLAVAAKLNLWPVEILTSLLMSLLFTSVCAIGFLAFRPRLIVKEGKVRLADSMRVKETHLGNCQWHLGKASEMTVFLSMFDRRDPVVLVEIPTSGLEEDCIVAVGLTNQMREVWSSFLRLAAVRNDNELEESLIRLER